MISDTLVDWEAKELVWALRREILLMTILSTNSIFFFLLRKQHAREKVFCFFLYESIFAFRLHFPEIKVLAVNNVSLFV